MHIDYRSSIQESVAELQSKESKSQKPAILRRLQLLRLLKSGQVSSRERTAELIGMSSRQASRLWKTYQQQGLAGLCDYQPGGCKEKLTTGQKAQLQQAAAQGQFATLWQACNYVAETFSVSYTQPGMWSLFRSMKIKLKTARPRHYKQDQLQAEAFKKTSHIG